MALQLVCDLDDTKFTALASWLCEAYIEAKAHDVSDVAAFFDSSAMSPNGMEGWVGAWRGRSGEEGENGIRI